MLCLVMRMCRRISLRAWVVLMFVYIDTASQVNILAVAGSGGCRIKSSLSANEELIYEGIFVE
jgi:hypothetical protein